MMYVSANTLDLWRCVLRVHSEGHYLYFKRIIKMPCINENCASLCGHTARLYYQSPDLPGSNKLTVFVLFSYSYLCPLPLLLHFSFHHYIISCRCGKSVATFSLACDSSKRQVIWAKSVVFFFSRNKAARREAATTATIGPPVQIILSGAKVI